MRQAIEVGVVLAAIALLSSIFGADGAITAVVCWCAIRAVSAGMAGASAVACGLLAYCAYSALIWYEASLYDGEVPLMAPFAAIWLAVFGAILGALLARRIRARRAAKSE